MVARCLRGQVAGGQISAAQHRRQVGEALNMVCGGAEQAADPLDDSREDSRLRLAPADPAAPREERASRRRE
jgi:hypothetical protein